MSKAKAYDKQGSWFADVKQGDTLIESLPCIHKTYLETWPHYCDTGLGEATISSDQRIEEYVAAIKRSGKVILADASFTETTIKREGYIAVYRVANVEHTERGVEMDLTERLYNLQ